MPLNINGNIEHLSDAGGAKGFTGFNPDMVRKQISNFYQYEANTTFQFEKTIRELFSSLKESWYSPLAVKFSECSDSIRTLIGDLSQGYERIIVNAVNAYNINANANGWPTMSAFGCEERPYGTVSLMIDMQLSEISPDGVVGMNKNAVREALDVFDANIKECIDMVDKTPYNISIYDEEGSQVASFKAEISRLKEKIVTNLSEMKHNINLSIEKEIEVIDKAKNNATESLGGAVSSGSNSSSANYTV